MPARHFSSVLLPLPLRPTMPKNSPWRTSKETSRKASSSLWRALARGCRMRSLSVVACWCGIEKVFESESTATAAGRLGPAGVEAAGSCCEAADTGETVAAGFLLWTVCPPSLSASS